MLWKEVISLQDKSEELQKENKRLKTLYTLWLQPLKNLFKKILHIGTEKEKDNAVDDIKTYHELDYYSDNDLRDIVDDTPREEEIKDYIFEQNYGYDKDYDDRDIEI